MIATERFRDALESEAARAMIGAAVGDQRTCPHSGTLVTVRRGPVRWLKQYTYSPRRENFDALIASSYLVRKIGILGRILPGQWQVATIVLVG